MTTGRSVLADLIRGGAQLWVQAGELGFRMLHHPLSDNTLDNLRTHKPEIMRIIGDGVQISTISPSQQALWLISQLHSHQPYKIHYQLQIRGKLNTTAMETAITTLSQRHQIFCTSFFMIDDLPIMASLPGAKPVFEYIKFSATSSPELAYSDISNREQDWEFDLANGGLARFVLVLMGEEEHRLLITMHHIITDGWSGGVLMRDLGELYQAICEQRAPALRRLKMQYADFCVWQQARLVQGDMEEHLGYWREQLRDLEVTELIPDRILREARTFAGDSVRFELEAAATARLKELARREGCTLFMAALSGFVILLKRYTGRNDVAVGSPVANRTRQEFEDLIGFFVNTVVLRTNMEGNPSYLEVLRRVRETTLGAYTHQDVPFEQVVEHVKPHRKLNENPLFRIMFILHNLPKAEMRVAGLKCFMPEPVSRWSAFDVTVSLEEEGGRLCGHIEYSTELWEQSTIKRLSEHYRRLLAQAAAAPQTRISEFALLEKAEEEQLLKVWNGTGKSGWTGKAVHQLIEAQVERTPEAVAVFAGEKQLSYRELNERANRIAHRLRELGAGPDVVIGICLDRSLEMVVALLAVLKAGAAYLPLDPALPEKRIRHMVEDSQPPSILTRPDLAAPLTWYEGATVYLTPGGDDFQEHNSANLEVPLHPGNLMYVIYTSGSTGKPKGVAVPHEALISYLRSMRLHLMIQVGDSFALMSTWCADLSHTNLYITLSCGASLDIVPETAALDPELLEMYFYQRRPDIMKVTPSYLAAFASYPGFPRLLPRKLLILGGEILSPGLLGEIRGASDDLVILNHYGPTETTVGAAVARLEPQTEADIEEPLAVGRPLEHVRLYVLDGNLEFCPRGAIGELYIGGAATARGYLRKPELTSCSFMPDPYSAVEGSRMYCTGDMARLLTDGRVQVLGRIDRQIKIRGYRVELGEIECVLNACSSVRESVVVIDRTRVEQPQLIAYVILVKEGNVAAIVNHLKSELPPHAVPSKIIPLSKLPLGGTGKIEYGGLPVAVEPLFLSSYCSLLEERLAQIWGRLLGLDRVGPNEDFFELGGHSLLAVRHAIAVTRELNVKIPPAALFTHRTVKSLALFIRHKRTLDRTYCAVLQSGASRIAFCCFPGNGGTAACFGHLARELGSTQSVYAFEPVGLWDSAEPIETVEEMAASYVSEILTLPHREIVLLGHSLGGLVAYESARQLVRLGAPPDRVILIDTDCPANSDHTVNNTWDDAEWICSLCSALQQYVGNGVAIPIDQIKVLTAEGRLELMRELLGKSAFFADPPTSENVRRLLRVFQANHRAARRYRGGALMSPLLFIGGLDSDLAQLNAWRTLCEGDVLYCRVEGQHVTMIRPPYVGDLAAEILRYCRAQVESDSEGSD